MVFLILVVLFTTCCLHNTLNHLFMYTTNYNHNSKPYLLQIFQKSVIFLIELKRYYLEPTWVCSELMTHYKIQCISKCIQTNSLIIHKYRTKISKKGIPWLSTRRIDLLSRSKWMSTIWDTFPTCQIAI